MKVTTIGLDIAKNVFQVHGIDASEKVVVRKQLRRGQVLAFFEALPPLLIGMEACATAHYWARELTKLGPPGSSDAGEGREGLRQAQQERRRRCRGNLRGGTAAEALAGFESGQFCTDSSPNEPQIERSDASGVRIVATPKEYARFAEHCLQMVTASADQKSRAIQREMAAEWIRLADATRHPSKRAQMQMG
jgi:hypothetical protein